MQKNGSNAGRAWIFFCVVLAIVGAGGLTGCGEIAFKRGSGPDAFADDRRRCQSENADPAAVRACLAQAGWHVTDMEAGAAPVAAPAAPPPMTVAVPPAPPVVAVPAVAAPDGVVPPPPATPKILIVGNWWRIGSGVADLHATGDSCVAKLGPADAPDAGYHRVTPGFYACLRAGGWHGQARAGG